MNNFLEILVIFLLLIANGIFAMSEIAIVSARKARLQQLADEGNSKARAALALAEQPNQFLATVQIGITLVGILAGAFGGATLADRLADYVDAIPFLAPYSRAIGVGLVVIAITYFSLVIGELAPKRLGLNNAERIAMIVTPPMRALSWIASPLVWLLDVSTDAALRLLGIKSSNDPPVTEEEIKILIEQGTQTGVFEEVEQVMIESVLRLDEQRVNAVMTPRPQIVWFDLNDSPEEIRSKVTNSRHSRFPVVENDLDNVLGIVYAKDLLAQNLGGQPLDLRSLLHPALFLPEGLSVLKVLEALKREQSHIALVTDEYGGIEGIVTPTDILETIVGYIPSIETPIEPEARQRDDGSWLLDGFLSIDEFKEIFDLKTLPGEEWETYHTMAGFVLSQTQAIPYTGQQFEWEQMRFEIVDMDGRRVDKVLVTPIHPTSLPNNEE